MAQEQHLGALLSQPEASTILLVVQNEDGRKHVSSGCRRKWDIPGRACHGGAPIRGLGEVTQDVSEPCT